MLSCRCKYPMNEPMKIGEILQATKQKHHRNYHIYIVPFHFIIAM